MKSNLLIKTIKKSIRIAVWMFFVLVFTYPLKAQPTLTSNNLGLNGGGIAYFSGSESAFSNPANLMLPNRPGSMHLSIGQAALHINPILSSNTVSGHFTNFRNRYRPYIPKYIDINSSQRNTILEKHFPGQELKANTPSRAEVMLGGIHWYKNDFAISISLRARIASRITTGRGWYDVNFIGQNDRSVRDFTLSQQQSELYELSFGYAQDFTFVNGLMPGLSKLYIGLAPKLVIAGPQFDARYHARYYDDGINTQANPFTSEFSLQSTGRFSNAIQSYMQSGNPRQAVQDNFGSYRFEQSGLGLGFDFGLNYVIPLSDEGLSQRMEGIPKKSLRIALSLTDIGVLRQTEQPLTINTPGDTTMAQQQSPLNEMFIGSGGQYINQLHQAESLPNPFLSAEETSEEAYSTMLPTSVNAGILVDLSTVKFIGDLTLGLDNSAFTSKNLSVYLGMEARPLEKIPLRMGTRLASNMPLQVGFSTGLETKYWDFTLGSQALIYPQSQQAALAGGAIGGLQFHF